MKKDIFDPKKTDTISFSSIWRTLFENSKTEITNVILVLWLRIIGSDKPPSGTEDKRIWYDENLLELRKIYLIEKITLFMKQVKKQTTKSKKVEETRFFRFLTQAAVRLISCLPQIYVLNFISPLFILLIIY